MLTTGGKLRKSQRAARRVRGRLSRAPAACGAPRLNVALARRLSTSRRRCWRRRARAVLTDRARARRNWHGARATSSVDGWASMALRSHVVERGGGCEVFIQSAAELGPTARSAPACRTQSRLREHGGRRTTCHGLMCRCPGDSDGLWLCGLKSPDSRLRPPFSGDV